MMITLSFPLPHLTPEPFLSDNLRGLILQSTGLKAQLGEVLPHSAPLSHPLCNKFIALFLPLLPLLEGKNTSLLKNYSLILLTKSRILRKPLLKENRTFSANLFSLSAAILTTTYLMLHLFLPPLLLLFHKLWNPDLPSKRRL